MSHVSPCFLLQHVVPCLLLASSRPRGRSAACVCCASSLIIESGSLGLALSPEETAGGVAGSATSTVYTIMAIKLRVEAQHMARTTLHQGGSNFACGANYPHQALKGGYFVFRRVET